MLKNQNIFAKLWSHYKGLGSESIPQESEAALAVDLLASLPPSLVSLFDSDAWKGGPLLVMRSPQSKATAAEVAINSVWIRPIVARFPSKVRVKSFSK